MVLRKGRFSLLKPRTLALALALSVGLPVSAYAYDREDETTSILKRMADYLAGQNTISAKFDSSIEIITPELEKIQFNSTGEVLLNRPDKLRLSRSGGNSDVEILFDGKTVTILGRKLNAFAQIELPGATDQFLEKIRTEYKLYVPGADLLITTVFPTLTKDILDAKHIGTAMIRGVECEHLAFRNEETDWQVWIQKGPQPIPRKLIITSKAVTGAPQYELLIDAWRTEVPAKPESFAFTAPAGARKLEFKELAALPEIDEVPPGLAVGVVQ